MLTVQSYQPISNRYNYNPAMKSGMELSSKSKLLVQAIKDIFSTQKDAVMRSKRFNDGSFVEIQNSGNGIFIKYMRINQKPVEVHVTPNNKISAPNNQINPNLIIEKYIPDAIDTMNASL